jgi:tetratricopeptide (TPR) repeat protein
MRLALVAACTLWLAGRPVPAAADNPYAAAQARATAKKHAVRAAADYKAGQFLPALEGYTRAYDLAPQPEVLFNIGQCHFQLSSWERAVFFYRAYLHDRPEASNRALVEDLIAEAEREQAKREAARAMPLPVEPARREAEITGAAPAQPEPPVYQRWWFWAAVGAAAVAGSTALYLQDDGGKLPRMGVGLAIGF